MENKEIIKLAKAAKDGKIEVVIRSGEAEKFLDPVMPIKKTKLEISANIGS
jgi:hypothetical protein